MISSESVATMTSSNSGEDRTPSYTRAIRVCPAIWRSIFRGSRGEASRAGMTAMAFMPTVSIFCLPVAIEDSVPFLLAVNNDFKGGSANWLGLRFGAVAEGHQEYCVFAFGMWGEEAGYVIVVKGKAGGAQMLGVGCEVELAAENAGFDLH